MANWSGTLATLVALVRPRTVRPHLVVPSIASLDWSKLAEQVDAVVIDKDNCIARPSQDSLADDPQLRHSWAQLLDHFGPHRVLVVSNSAGDLRKDPILLQAESVSRNLRVPVLAHQNPKPAYACAKLIANHFLRDPSSSETSPVVVYSPLARWQARARAPKTSTRTSDRDAFRVLVVGDRLATDMILAHRLASLSLPLSPSSSRPSFPFPFPFPSKTTRTGHPQRIETVAVLTTHLWGSEGLGTTALRLVEKWAVSSRRHEAAPSPGPALIDWRDFLLPAAERAEEKLEASSLLPASSSPSAPQASTRPPGTAFFKSQGASTPPPTPFLPRIRQHLHSLSTLPSRVPSLLSSWAHSIPTSIHNLTTRAVRALVRQIETSSPRWIARLEKASKRLVQAYSPAADAVDRPTMRAGAGAGPVTRMIESATMDKLERQWNEAGRTLDRFSFNAKDKDKKFPALTTTLWRWPRRRRGADDDSRGGGGGGGGKVVDVRGP